MFACIEILYKNELVYRQGLRGRLMTVYGYWRCSTDLQDQERQVLALDQAGCEKIYGDKITGTSNYGDREELSKCLEQLQRDDLLVLEDMTRLGRTMVTRRGEVNNLM